MSIQWSASMQAHNESRNDWMFYFSVMLLKWSLKSNTALQIRFWETCDSRTRRWNGLHANMKLMRRWCIGRVTKVSCCCSHASVVNIKPDAKLRGDAEHEPDIVGPTSQQDYQARSHFICLLPFVLNWMLSVQRFMLKLGKRNYYLGFVSLSWLTKM